MRPGTGRRLGKDDHAALIRRAVECAEHVPPLFDAACPADLRLRAAGHAAGTGHVPGHARHAAEYALKAATASGDPAAGAIERAWQFRRLPARLRSVATLSSQNARARNS